MKAIRQILFFLLAATYLLTASMYAVNVLASGIPASGADTIVAPDSSSKEIPQKLSVQRRHISLASDIPCPSVHIGETEFPPIADEENFALTLQFIKHTHAYYYSSLCDRAPPIA